jgi:uncharacterized protein (TIGR00369 family)
MHTAVTEFQARNPRFAEQLEAGLATMPIVQTLGLRFVRITPGEVEIAMPYADQWSFRPGQFQATPMFAVADFAAVCAAGTLIAEGWSMATVDVTLKIVGPAMAGPLRAVGRVLKAGKLLTVSEASVYAFDGRGESLCATALVTGRNLPPA